MVDIDGFLKITGRVKDLFKTSKGKYIAPSPIEMKLSENNYIEQVCIVGTGIPQPIALVVASEEGKKSLDVLKDSLKNTLAIINDILEKHEIIHNIIVVDDVWTVDNKLLTPSMKIKRNLLDKKYKENYLLWYEMDRITIL